MATSAMPNAGNTPPGLEAERLGRGSTNASTAVGSTGSAPLSASVSGDRSRPLHPPQRTGGEHPREVRPGGGGAAVVADPLHPVARAGPGSPAARPARGRRPSSSACARNPTRPMSWYSGSHDTITSSSAELGRLARGVEVGAEHPVGEHHALRLAGRAARVLQDDEALGIVARAARALGARRTSRRRAARRPSARSADRPAPARRTRRAGRRSARAWRRRGGCGPGSTSTNASSEPIRIGSGSTMLAGRPASSPG